jgi:hypothetical protein
MSSASSKDIQDLSKSIQALIKTVGTVDTPTSKKSSSRPSTTQSSAGLSDKQVKAGFGGLEAKEALNKSELDFRARLADYDKKAIDASKQLQANQKAWGTELYKTLDLTEAIDSVSEDIYDTHAKYLKAKKAGNTALANEYSLSTKVLRNKRDTLKTQQENAKQQDKAQHLAEKQLETYKKITDSIKAPIHALEGAVDNLSESMGKRFNASLAAPKKSIMDIATNGLKFGVVAALAMGVKRAFEMNQELTDMRRTVGLSAEEADHVHHALQDATLSSTVLGATSHDTAAAFESLRDTFGTAVASNHELIDSQILLTKQIGLSNEEAANFQDMSAGSGKSAQENLAVITETVEQYNKMTGDSVSVRGIQKDVAKVSKATLASYHGMGPALVKAVTVAKKLGMSLEDTQSISKNLLNIEESVGAEMEANVLTGKHVNMNAARNLALQGDSAGAAAEALKQIGSYDEFMNMGVLQQEALAKAAGMTVDQVVKAGQEEKKNAIMKHKSYKDLTQSQKDQLVKEKILTKEQIEQNTKDEQAASVKERLVALTDKLMTAFDTMVTNTITPWLEKLEHGLEYIGKAGAATKAFIKQTFPTWVVDLMKNSGTVLKAGAGIAVAFVALKKVGGMISGFLTGKAGDSAKKPIYAAIVSGAKKIGGFAGRGMTAARGMGGGILDKVKGLGGLGKGLLEKYKAGKAQGGGWKSGLKSLFTKSNLAETATGAINQATGTETSVGDEGPIGTKADPISVQVVGGLGSGPTASAGAGPEDGGSPVAGLATDAATSMLGKTKIGKKLGIGSGGMMDSLIGGAVGMFTGGGEEGGGGGVVPNGPAMSAPSGNVGGGASAPSPKPSSGGDSGGGGGFGSMLSGLWDSVKGSKLVTKVGDFAKKLNPMGKLKEWLPKLFGSKGPVTKLLGKLPEIGPLISMASTLYSLGSDAVSADSYQEVGGSVVRAISSMGGTFLAGALGSVVPGAGTMLGGILGGMAGDFLGGLIADNVDLSGLGKSVVDILGGGAKSEKPVAVQDALIRPGMPPITFDKGDMILAGTNLQGAPAGSAGSNGTAGAAGANASQGSLSEVAGILKQILAATNTPVNVNIGGKVISEIDSLSTLRRNYVGKMDSAHGAF